MSLKYVFVGNRYYVLQKMLDEGLNVTKIYAVKNSFLEEYLLENKIPFQSLESKDVLTEELIEEEFDILVSNGCPYILPISKIKEHKPKSKFINIHPSLLPDCRGKSPINAALLFNRRHGVTCHFMDDGVDTGGL